MTSINITATFVFILTWCLPLSADTTINMSLPLPQGFESSIGNGLAYTGSIQVGSAVKTVNGIFYTQPILWDGDTIVEYVKPDGALFGSLSGISPNGLHAVGSYQIDVDTTSVPSYWKSPTQLVDLPSLTGLECFVNRISNDGNFMTGYARDESLNFFPIYWSNGSVAHFTKDARHPSTFISDMSADGRIVIGNSYAESLSSEYDYRIAIRWTNTVHEILSVPSGYTDAFANGVSDDGNIIVGKCDDEDGNSIGIIWNRSSIDILDPLPGFESCIPEDCNADGTIIVGICMNSGVFDSETSESTPSEHVPFIWDAGHGMRVLFDLLDTSEFSKTIGWTTMYAFKISGDGLTITGTGTDPEGNDYKEWYISLDPTVYEGLPEPEPEPEPNNSIGWTYHIEQSFGYNNDAQGWFYFDSTNAGAVWYTTTPNGYWQHISNLRGWVYYVEGAWGYSVQDSSWLYFLSIPNVSTTIWYINMSTGIWSPLL